jgi:hypothetical protein
MEVHAELERVRLQSQQLGIGALVVHTVSGAGQEMKLTLWGTSSAFELTPGQLAALKKQSVEDLLDCCRQNTDKVKMLHPVVEGSNVGTNEDGQRWWVLMFGSDVVRKTGIAFIAIAAAIDETDATARVAKVNELFEE